jgi:hypothetical protein
MVSCGAGVPLIHPAAVRSAVSKVASSMTNFSDFEVQQQDFGAHTFAFGTRSWSPG